MSLQSLDSGEQVDTSGYVHRHISQTFKIVNSFNAASALDLPRSFHYNCWHAFQKVRVVLDRMLGEIQQPHINKCIFIASGRALTNPSGQVKRIAFFSRYSRRLRQNIIMFASRDHMMRSNKGNDHWA